MSRLLLTVSAGVVLAALGSGCKKQKITRSWIDDRDPVELRGGGEVEPVKHAALPKVISAGGDVVEQPKIVPIFFNNDSPELIERVTEFLSTVGTSDYWTATTAEYGVGEATATPAIVINEPRSGDIDARQIEVWLLDQLERANPVLPAANPNNIYVMHFPREAKILYGGSESCSTFAGYHGELYIPGRYPELSVAYAVIARCSSDDDIDDVTVIDSHELVEAATDPFINGRPAYYTTDQDHLIWSLSSYGGEVADLCQLAGNSVVQLPGMAYAVQRSWSNEAAKSGRDPCQPALPGEVYFNTAPTQTEPVVLYIGDRMLNTRGLTVHVGQTRTVELVMFSEARTDEPWNVDVYENWGLLGEPPSLQLSLDKQQGVHGDKLKLTIQVLRTNGLGGAPIVVRSTKGAEVHNWIELVAF